MKTPITDRDLTRQPPHSPRDRIAGFVLAMRAVDKCRASINGSLGEYHYDCPMDNKLFTFKGITGMQFKAAVRAARNYEDIGTWLQTHGTAKTAEQIKAWSDAMEADSLKNDPEKRSYFVESCHEVGLDPETTTTFDWLETDDRVTFGRQMAHQAARP
jgi:hypothetical protein